MRTLALPVALAVFGACGPGPKPVTPTDPTTDAPVFTWKSFPRVDVVDSSYLVPPPVALDTVAGLEQTLTGAGVPADQIPAILQGADPTNWPDPLADENQRYNAYTEIGLMRVHQIAYLTAPGEKPAEDGGGTHTLDGGEPNYDDYYEDYYGYPPAPPDPNWVLLAVLADENQHLKPELRPAKDFFTVFVEWGVRPIDKVAPRPGTTVDAKKFDSVKIDPERVYGYAGLKWVTGIEDILKAAGVPEAAIPSIYARSEEGGWPPELRWDRRTDNAGTISSYKARKLADLESGTLVMIAAAENQHLPEAVRPKFDFYMMVEPAGVTPR